ncbi:hypothetical protein [Shimia sp.]|uniref:hypothetical protein n=1 Tax=Shimia sp. TaxID=1954381 RepID=UPI003566068E
MSNDILATVRASGPRRWLGVGVLSLLGAILLYLGLTMPSGALHWQLFLIVLGAAALWVAEKTRRATERVVELTAEGLRDNGGEVIAALDQITRIERGMFAMKPSNGFLVRLKTPVGRRWLPGLWWRLGRRVGIGGVTPGAETKVMAQMLEAMIAERAAQDSQTS